MRTWIYGVGDPTGHESRYKEAYEAHNAAVIEYFAQCADGHLVLATTGGEDWGKLCLFLSERSPEVPFPHRRPQTGNAFGQRIGRRLCWLFPRE